MASTSFGVFDNGWKYIYDRFADKYRYVPLNGDVAGLCASVTANGTPWFSPAGLNRGAIRGAVKLVYSPTKTERDALYQKRINPVTSLPNRVSSYSVTKLLSLHHLHLIASMLDVYSM